MDYIVEVGLLLTGGSSDRQLCFRINQHLLVVGSFSRAISMNHLPNSGPNRTGFGGSPLITATNHTKVYSSTAISHISTLEVVNIIKLISNQSHPKYKSDCSDTLGSYIQSRRQRQITCRSSVFPGLVEVQVNFRW